MEGSHLVANWFSRSLAGALLLLPCLTHAQQVWIEPDFFDIQTDLTYAFPGVTLTVEGGGGGTVITRGGFDTFNSRNLATTGWRVFGYTPLKPPIMSGKVWDQSLGLLRVDFASPVRAVQIDMMCDDDGEGGMWAYDAAGNEIGRVTASCDGRDDVRTSTLAIKAIRRAISYVTAGGLQQEALFLDNLRYWR